MAKSLVLNRSRKVPAEDTAAFGAIAERFRRAGALERAVDLCREGLQKFPDHVSARVTLGWSLLDLGQYDEARVELEQVLRRAPDNLAAIRGLAELHDRFEHTLQLPMDGPGQWPPSPESVDEASAEAPAPAADDDPAGDDLEMAPAALGIPIWSPPVSPPPEVETPLARAASVPATAPAPTTATAMTPVEPPAPAPAATSTSVATAAVAAPPTPAPPAASEPVKVETAASGSGMSSVREIDFAPEPSTSVPGAAMEEPSVATVDPREELVETSELAADACAVSDADIQALIAEAESLNAAAVAMPAESETISVDAMALGTEDPVAVVEEVAPAVSYSSVTEPISVDLELDAAPAEIAAANECLTMEVASAEAAAEFAHLEVPASEPVVESAIEAVETFEAALEIAAPIVEAALEIEEPAVAASAPVELAVGAALEAEQTFETALEIAAPIVDAALEIDEPESESIELAAPALAVVAEVVSIETGRIAPRSPVPALERFLTKVQARRAQLMAESVA